MAVEPIELRAASGADIEAVIAVTLEAYRQFADHMGPEHWEDYKQNILETLRGSEGAESILALLDGQAAGSILLLPPGPAAASHDVEEGCAMCVFGAACAPTPPAVWAILVVAGGAHARAEARVR